MQINTPGSPFIVFCSFGTHVVMMKNNADIYITFALPDIFARYQLAIACHQPSHLTCKALKLY